MSKSSNSISGFSSSGMFFSFPACCKASSSSSSFSISRRGKIGSPFFTCSPFIISKVKASAHIGSANQSPSCFLILPEVVCMNGSMSTETIRMASARLWRTLSSLGLSFSSLASTHGMVSSMYLLALLTTVQMSSSAMLKANLSMLASTFEAAPIAMAFRSSSSGSVASVSAGTVPPLYFSIMETVRETRLPRSFARS